MKKISVIVNCHNGEKYLFQCILSIINQTYRNFEIIVFDNYSSDQSKNIINNFKDNRIKYYKSDVKLSLYEARNQAIKKTTGEFIAFLDVDDWWDKNYLNSRKQLFNSEEYDLFYTNASTYYQNSKIFKKYKKFNLPSGKIYDSLAKDYFIIISGLIIRKIFFYKIGEFNPNLNIIGDFDFIMRASKKANFHGLNQPLIFYRVHKNNFSKLNSEMFFEEYKRWFENNNIDKKDIKFQKNIKFFRNKLNYLEITSLLINKKKNLLLIKKILQHEMIFEKIKFLILFFLPKKLLKFLKK
jgi:glycosyltransferase involved in cell wall biosynthesis